MCDTRIIESTPLNVVAHGIRTCWQSFGKSDNGGSNDLILIDRIGNKYKHASTLEHIIIVMASDSKKVLSWFALNKFSRVTGDGFIFTNLRVLLENKYDVLHLVPDLKNCDFGYLFKDTKELTVEELPDGIAIADFTITENNVSLMYSTDEYSDEKFYTFYIKGISRALLQELSRHRRAGMSVKSTRYTLKELKDRNLKRKNASEFLVLTGDKDVDKCSFKALKNTQKLLKLKKSNDLVKFSIPEAYKTELTWTISKTELKNFIELRTAKAALWEIRDLANEIKSLIA